jgi:hypothetical protein
VKKKLRTLSTNLHATILTNATRAISNCVDEVLHAFCNTDTSTSRGPTFAGQLSAKDCFLSNEDSIHCNDLLHNSHGNLHFTEATGSTSRRAIIEDMILYYMDSSFPPFPQINIEDSDINSLLSTSDVYKFLVPNIYMKKEEHPITDFDVDDFLSKEFLEKVAIPTCDEGYEHMTILGLSLPLFL